MIILKHSGGFPIETEIVKVPKIYVANLSNATDIIYFETKEECENYMNEKYPNIEEL